MSDGQHYDLLVPFIAATSNGGPYDDAAFVAGWHCATIWCQLQLRPSRHMETVLSTLVPQLDLVAMHHGYSMTVEPSTGGDEWSFVMFDRTNEETPS